MKVKIISDGTSHGTKVLNNETNEMLEIEGMQKIAWNITVDGISKCTIDFINVPVEIVTKTKMRSLKRK